MKKTVLVNVVAVFFLMSTVFVFAEGDKKGAGSQVAPFKIGIITGTVSQTEEEYRTAEMLKNRYPNIIIQSTYPDNFMAEQETTITNILAMASDPACKAILICQGIPGTCAAIDKLREMRKDVLFIATLPQEDPNMVASKADLVLQPDEYLMGTPMVEQAKKLGAKTFVHISFPRHMSYQILSARRELIKQKCAENGIKYVDVTAPDPTGDAGVPGTQQFILEEVPRLVAKYGKDTAIFGTNCSMQEPLIKQVLKNKAIYVIPCCPSPYHGFPAGLSIEIPMDKKGDVPFILKEIKNKVATGGNTGRMSTWPVPCNMMMILAGVEYAKAYLEGRTNGMVDPVYLQKVFNTEAATLTKVDNMEVEIYNFDNFGKGPSFKNYFMMMEDFYTF